MNNMNNKYKIKIAHKITLCGVTTLVKIPDEVRKRFINNLESMSSTFKKITVNGEDAVYYKCTATRDFQKCIEAVCDNFYVSKIVFDIHTRGLWSDEGETLNLIWLFTNKYPLKIGGSPIIELNRIKNISAMIVKIIEIIANYPNVYTYEEEIKIEKREIEL